MSDWSLTIGVIVCALTGFICYAKGVCDGLEKKDKDIEKMIVEAISKYNEVK